MTSTSPSSSNSPDRTADDAAPSIWTRILASVLLPPTVSAFEQSYLRRMNRVALWFFAAHLPAFMIVAAWNGTGVIEVGLLTAAVLAIPVLGTMVLTSERQKSYVAAFTAMCLGGVLVHAGQGPLQIEMHFYFFSVLAMMALFANPLTILVGAGTVAAHHLVLWYLAPSSVFNYDAPIWVVLVHAGFVVLETVAACFIARNFFDNVVGLEKKVAQRTAELAARNDEMRLVLGTVGQGLVTVDASGRMHGEHSRALTDHLGEYEAGALFAEYLEPTCPKTSSWFALNWESVEDGFLPLELALDQLPKRLESNDRTLAFEYRANVDDQGELESMLVVTSDISQEVAQQKAEAMQRELLTMLERAIRDRGGFSAFCAEVTQLLQLIAKDGPPGGEPATKRAVHTIKGNAAVFGLGSVAEACHELETAWSDLDESATHRAVDQLQERWRKLSDSAHRLLGASDVDTIGVSVGELERALHLSIDSGATGVASILAELLLEPTSPALERLEFQAKKIAERLGRAPLRTTVEANEVRTPRGTLQPVWSALTHAVRNAVDHGIEPPEERSSNNKPESGEIVIETRYERDLLTITVRDDGRGIDWDLVRSKASERGLPHANEDDLTRALFSDEFSTCEVVTDLSGRGVGLAAVYAAVDDLDGSVSIQTRPGGGTELSLELPISASPLTPGGAPGAPGFED